MPTSGVPIFADDDHQDAVDYEDDDDVAAVDDEDGDADEG